MDTTAPLQDNGDGQPRPARVLARVATTGIYLVRGVPCR